MAPTRDWEGTIRAVVSHALSQRGCRRGWTVLNHRGNVRLNIAAGAAGGKRRQVLLPIPWQCDQVDEIRDAAVYVFDEFQKGVDPDLCVARILRTHHAASGAGLAADAPGLSTSSSGGSQLSATAAPLSIEDWSELIGAFRDYKLLSGEIKGSSWERVYRHCTT